MDQLRLLTQTRTRTYNGSQEHVRDALRRMCRGRIELRVRVRVRVRVSLKVRVKMARVTFRCFITLAAIDE